VRRARREHRARSDERAAALIAAMQVRGAEARIETVSAGAPPGAVGAASAVAGAAAEAGSPASAAPPPLAGLRRPRFLTEPQRLLYLVLRAALPDHVVMANTRMVDLLDVPSDAAALEGDARLREMLHLRLDCVVCRNDLVPVAAIVVYAPGMPNAPDERTQAERLRELGIKFLRFRSDSLPRPAEMRALVLS
jgi:hypothetical protein